MINANDCCHVMRMPDLKLTVDFEHAAGRLTCPVIARLHVVDWYEAVARRE